MAKDKRKQKIVGELSTEELKALAYDINRDIQIMNNKLIAINQEIIKRENG